MASSSAAPVRSLECPATMRTEHARAEWTTIASAAGRCREIRFTKCVLVGSMLRNGRTNADLGDGTAAGVNDRGTHEACRSSHPDVVIDARLATLDVTGISADSRTIKPGDLFVAVAGAKDDGLRFVAPALAAGAAAVMAERALPTAPPTASPSSRSAIVRRALALAAAKFFRASRRRSRRSPARAGRPRSPPSRARSERARRTGGEHRHRRPRCPDARGLRLAHHARSGRAAPLARRACRRGRDPPRHGSFLARL